MIEDSRIRRLSEADRASVEAHLLRLDREARRRRFFGAVADQFVQAYAERLLGNDVILHGAFPDGTLRGIGELHVLAQSLPLTAEAAFSVEPEWQDMGIGSALTRRIVAEARSLGIDRLRLNFLAENLPMRRIACRHDASLCNRQSDIEAVIFPLVPPQPAIRRARGRPA